MATTQNTNWQQTGSSLYTNYNIGWEVYLAADKQWYARVIGNTVSTYGPYRTRRDAILGAFENA